MINSSTVNYLDNSVVYKVDVTNTQEALKDYAKGSQKGGKVWLQLVKGEKNGQPSVWLEPKDTKDMGLGETLLHLIGFDVFGFKDVIQFLAKTKVDCPPEVKKKLSESVTHYNAKCWFEGSTISLSLVNRIGNILNKTVRFSPTPGHQHLRRGKNCEEHYEEIQKQCGQTKNFGPYIQDFKSQATQKSHVPLDLLQDKYDIYDTDFQDFALRMTQKLSNGKRKEMATAQRRVQRAQIAQRDQ